MNRLIFGLALSGWLGGCGLFVILLVLEMCVVLDFGYYFMVVIFVAVYACIVYGTSSTAAYKSGYKYGLKSLDGYKVGKQEGFKEGFKYGDYASAYDAGKLFGYKDDDAYKSGYKDGLKDGK